MRWSFGGENAAHEYVELIVSRYVQAELRRTRLFQELFDSRFVFGDQIVDLRDGSQHFFAVKG